MEDRILYRIAKTVSYNLEPLHSRDKWRIKLFLHTYILSPLPRGTPKQQQRRSAKKSVPKQSHLLLLMEIDKGFTDITVVHDHHVSLEDGSYSRNKIHLFIGRQIF